LKNEEYLSYLVDMDKANFTGRYPYVKILEEKNQTIALGSASKTQDHLGENWNHTLFRCYC
jgi:hypothetical protein